MTWNALLKMKNYQSLLIGNFDFFNQYNFDQYFKAKYRLTKKQIKWIFLAFLMIILLFIGFQIIFFENLTFQGILFEFIFMVFLLRLVNHFLYLEFKEYRTTVETMGYFVINEILVILDTSHSLKEAVKFIISSNYPVYSEFFRNALMESHFGVPLESALKQQVRGFLQDNIRTIFLNIFETWEIGKNIALISKDRILKRISKQISEETEKIDLWASLSTGLIFLSPPVIVCFLLIAGKMSVPLGLVMTISMVIGSIFIDSDKNLILFSNNNNLLFQYDKNSLDFLIVLSENLTRGNSFSKSLFIAIQIVENNVNSEKNSEIFTQFRLGNIKVPEIEIELLKEIFSTRIYKIALLTKKFSKIDSSEAGKKLRMITKELDKTNSLLDKGKAQLKAIKLQTNIIQVFALISLAIIAGASPFFLFVANAMSKPLTESSVITENRDLEIVYFLMAFVLSYLPIRKESSHRLKKRKLLKKKEIISLSRFFLFLIGYYTIKNSFMGIY
ncbi:MAG: hypothetical protein ACXAC8_01885 [Candidatus Hodarchaeales archaeon]|jgi:hypothetical protein